MRVFIGHLNYLEALSQPTLSNVVRRQALIEVIDFIAPFKFPKSSLISFYQQIQKKLLIYVYL